MTVVSVLVILLGLVLLGINFPATLHALGNRGAPLKARTVVLFLAGMACLFVGFNL